MELEAIKAQAGVLLRSQGISTEFDLAPIPGGANNRVFRLSAADRDYLLKAYFRHEGDRRDRLGAEFRFLGFAWDNGIRCIPQPIARDEENNLGLYEFIQGSRLTAGEVNAEAVNQALNFFIELNQYKDDSEAGLLPQASEACFSIAAHLELVERRIGKLRGIDPRSDADREAKEFVDGELASEWDRIQLQVRKKSDEEGLQPGKEIEAEDRCLSPSDFGFHNALLGPDRSLKFIDFEYAGWDDPAKLVCDFFCQPEVPVQMEFFKSFAERVAALTASPATAVRCMRVLLPVYKVKWVCIMLNEFLRTGEARREFAHTPASDRKAAQLGKAKKALERIEADGFC